MKHERSTENDFPSLKGWCNFYVGQPEWGKWQNSKEVLLFTVDPEMKWYFLTNQETYFCFLVRVPFNFQFFSISSILKKNLIDPLAWATSLNIRNTFRGPPKAGSRATSDFGHPCHDLYDLLPSLQLFNFIPIMFLFPYASAAGAEEQAASLALEDIMPM